MIIANKNYPLAILLMILILSCNSTENLNGIYVTANKKMIMHIQEENVNIYFSPTAMHCSTMEILSNNGKNYTILNKDSMKPVPYPLDTVELSFNDGKLVLGEYSYNRIIPIKADSIIQYNHRNHKTVKQTIYQDYPKFNVLSSMIFLEEFEGFPKDLIADNISSNFEMYLNGNIIGTWETASVPFCLDLYGDYFPEIF